MSSVKYTGGKVLIKNLLKNEANFLHYLNKDTQKLSNIRVIQKNLVYVIGIPAELATRKVSN
jgi:hypothetical protein